MRYIPDGPGINFAVCDFCDRDESSNQIEKVYPFGEKGICDWCLRRLKELLDEVTP